MILFSMIVYLGCYTDDANVNGLKALVTAKQVPSEL